eukprot:2961593-Prymnesium_polylepis.1
MELCSKCRFRTFALGKKAVLCNMCERDHADEVAEVLDNMDEAGEFESRRPSRRCRKKQRGQSDKDVRRARNLAGMLLQRAPVEHPGEDDTELLHYEGDMVPDLRKDFKALDSKRKILKKINVLERLRQKNQCVALGWGCGSGKSFRIFADKGTVQPESLALLRDLLATFPDMPVLFVSCRVVHANDLHKELEDLGFVSYLDANEKTAEGMRSRIDAGEYKRVICSLQSARALPPAFMQAFRGRSSDAPGLVVYDEFVSSSAYVQEVVASKKATMEKPDESLDRLAELGEHAMVLAADADAFVHGGGLAFMRRVAPYKKVVGICSTKARLQRLVRIAFGYPQVKTGSKGPAAENPTCNAHWETLFAAVAAAKARWENGEGYPDRVGIVGATVTILKEIKRRLKERGLWSDDGCKMYAGKSTDKEDFHHTEERWHPCYLVMFNSTCTVAINIDVRFGSCFMFTSNTRQSALLRDLLQAVVRFWRKESLEPLLDGFNHGKCVVNVLLDCKPPDAEKVEIGPAEMRDWLQKRFERHICRLRGGAAHTRAHYHGAGRDSKDRERFADVSEDTLIQMAWNSAEKDADESIHLAYFLYLCFFPTRDFNVKRLVPTGLP